MNFRKAQPVRLVIADDHPIFRDGLRRLLEAESDLKVLGEASDGAEAVKLAKPVEAGYSFARPGDAEASGPGGLARPESAGKCNPGARDFADGGGGEEPDCRSVAARVRAVLC